MILYGLLHFIVRIIYGGWEPCAPERGEAPVRETAGDADTQKPELLFRAIPAGFNAGVLKSVFFRTVYQTVFQALRLAVFETLSKAIYITVFQVFQLAILQTFGKAAFQTIGEAVGLTVFQALGVAGYIAVYQAVLQALGGIRAGRYGAAGDQGDGNRWGKKCVCHVHNGVPLFFLR